MCDLWEVVNHYLFNYIKKGWFYMECIKNCRLCNKFILSQSITYNAGVNQLIVD